MASSLRAHCGTCSKGFSLPGLPVHIVEKIKECFFEGMDRQTSVYLFGSAATCNWVAGRSDVDLVVVAPKVKIDEIANQVRLWNQAPSHPKLDGYALSCVGRSCEAIHLERFEYVNFPLGMSIESGIELIDQWNIKYRSKLLFGEASIAVFFPNNITHEELNIWALGRLKQISFSNESVTKEFHWIVSWFARMLMLYKEGVCGSKQEALQWLGSRYSEVRDLVDFLLENYPKPGWSDALITIEQVKEWRGFCQKVLLEINEIDVCQG